MFLGIQKRSLAGFAAGAAAGISYGLNPLFGKPLLDGGVPVLSMLFFRYAISAVILGGWIWMRHGAFRVRWRELYLLVVLGFLFAGSSIFLFESYKYIQLGLATSLVYLYPVCVALIMVFLRVYPSWQVWLSICATVIGVALLGMKGDGGTLHLTGMLFAVLSALCYAVYLVIVNHSQRIRHLSESLLTFYALVVGAILFLTYLLWEGIPVTRGIDRISEAGCLVGLAVFPTMISMLTIALSTRLIGATKTSVLGVFEPITGILVGTWVFAEPLTTNVIIGIAICIAAVLFLILSEQPTEATATANAETKTSRITAKMGKNG